MHALRTFAHNLFANVTSHRRRLAPKAASASPWITHNGLLKLTLTEISRPAYLKSSIDQLAAAATNLHKSIVTKIINGGEKGNAIMNRLMGIGITVSRQLQIRYNHRDDMEGFLRISTARHTVRFRWEGTGGELWVDVDNERNFFCINPGKNSVIATINGASWGNPSDVKVPFIGAAISALNLARAHFEKIL